MKEKIILKVIRSIGSITSLLIHTILFIVFFVLYLFGLDLDTILLVLTTIVSLEAIYLAIFIQMSVNLHSDRFTDLQKDVDEIQDDVEEIQKDVEEINEEYEEDDIEEIKATLNRLMKEIMNLKNKR
jgi:uncharacterized membrane protein (DUF106 family)